MKFTVSFKTPDAFDQVSCDWDEENQFSDDIDRREEQREVFKKFVRDGEYITVEFDTEAETCVALKREK